VRDIFHVNFNGCHAGKLKSKAQSSKSKVEKLSITQC
jgi:hypothetical protein